jgi:hypothetical protein
MHCLWFQNRTKRDCKGKRTPFFSALLAIVLASSPGITRGSTLDVSVSGQFGAGVTDDSMAAPGESWSITFDVDSNPVAGNPDALGFDATFSNFTYMLNGSAVAVSPAEIRFYTTTGGGLFTLFFGPETGFNNGIPLPEFTFSGGQVFSGTPANPTILAGGYPISDVLYSDSINYDDEGASGSVAILSVPTMTSSPEPSTLWLFVAALSLKLLGKRVGRSGSRGTTNE